MELLILESEYVFDVKITMIRDMQCVLQRIIVEKVIVHGREAFVRALAVDRVDAQTTSAPNTEKRRHRGTGGHMFRVSGFGFRVSRARNSFKFEDN